MRITFKVTARIDCENEDCNNYMTEHGESRADSSKDLISEATRHGWKDNICPTCIKTERDAE